MNEQTQIQLKQNIETLLIECFKKAEQKKFKELNFSFPTNTTQKQFFKTKIETLKKLDIYSQTFVTIHTRAKIALREFKENKFEGAYLDLLKSVLTLPEKLNKQGLKSIAINEKTDLDKMKIGEDITVTEKNFKKPPMSKTKLLKQGVTGKKMNSGNTKLMKQIKQIQKIELNDEKNPLHDLKI